MMTRGMISGMIIYQLIEMAKSSALEWLSYVHSQIIFIYSRSRYPAVNGLYVHKPLCLSQTAYPLRLSVCPLSNGISKLILPLE